MAALHPDVEKFREKFRERDFVEIEFGFDGFGRTAGERRVHLEALEAKFLGVVAVKSVGTGVEAALMEYGDDTDVESGGFRLTEALSPNLRISIGAAVEELAMVVREVHRRAERAAEHGAQHVIPRGRVTNEIGLEMVREATPARGRGIVHDFARLHKPGWPHDHGFATLPVDLAFVDAFVLNVIEELLGEQRHEQHRKTVRLLVLETVGAGHVALRGGKEDDAEDAVAHDGDDISWLARSRVISSAADSREAKSCFTPAQSYAGSGHLK